MSVLTVGFCGRARHGKDFVAGVVRQHFTDRGFRVFHSSFSELVLERAIAFGLIESKSRADCNIEELSIIVEQGHDGRRTHPDFWIRRLSKKVAESQPDVVLIPGVRFPNEVEWLRSIDGQVVRVVRHNQDGSVYISPDRDPNGEMETILDRIVPDFELSAKTGQEEWLRSQARGLARHLEEAWLRR